MTDIKIEFAERKHVVIYHAHCQDGFAAAWCFWKKAQVEGQPEYSFIAGEYDKPLPKGLEGAHVYLVDFSYKRPEMLELLEKAHSVTMLDHHQSAIQGLLTGPDSLLNHSKLDAGLCTTNLSGAMLAWYYCFGYKKAPDVLLHIQDRDLWKFDLANTEKVSQYFFSLPYDFTIWTLAIYDYETSISKREAMQSAGDALTRAHDQEVESQCKKYGWVELCENIYPAVNASYNYASAIGAHLSPFYPAVVIYQILHDNTVKVSLRSNKDSELATDVAKLAEAYGGGGHKNAAGCIIALEEFADALMSGMANKLAEYEQEKENG